MSELSEFLLARIAEDELAAKAATGGSFTLTNTETIVDRDAQAALGWVEHVKRHTPARVLAECAAKRQIVELHQPLDNDPEPFCWNCNEETWPCKTMAALALPYADHPEFQEAMSGLDVEADGGTVDGVSFTYDQALLVAARTARDRADAWDEGYDAGYRDSVFDDHGISTDPEADEHPHPNPYRPTLAATEGDRQ